MAPEGSRFRYSLLLREIDSLRVDPAVSAIALVLVQLDGLEEINCRFGYVAGDKVLDECARRIAAVRREQDRVFELSATAFALLICNPLHEGHAVLGAEKLARVAGEPVALGAARARVRVRMGISLLPQPASSAEELLRQCELAVVRARLRDETYVVYTGADFAGSAGNGPAAVWFDVEQALNQNEFELSYQPQVCLASGRLVGAEVLVRWRHPRQGLLPPAQFLPAIEGGQNVRALLWFVLNGALREGAAWCRASPELRVAVNMAAGNLQDPDLVELVDEALRIWGFPARSLVLEITETALLRDAAGAALRLHELRALGCRVAIDDFGTGYSSLAYLRNLPVDELKVDRSFIAAMAAAERDRRIVESVVGLGHAVGLRVVAEGIEDEPVRVALAAMGCDVGQGFLFGRPGSGAELAAALRAAPQTAG